MSSLRGYLSRLDYPLRLDLSPFITHQPLSLRPLGTQNPRCPGQAQLWSKVSGMIHGDVYMPGFVDSRPAPYEAAAVRREKSRATPAKTRRDMSDPSPKVSKKGIAMRFSHVWVELSNMDGEEEEY
jgi:hypothetical protein